MRAYRVFNGLGRSVDTEWTVFGQRYRFWSMTAVGLAIVLAATSVLNGMDPEAHLRGTAQVRLLRSAATRPTVSNIRHHNAAGPGRITKLEGADMGDYFPPMTAHPRKSNDRGNLIFSKDGTVGRTIGYAASTPTRMTPHASRLPRPPTSGCSPLYRGCRSPRDCCWAPKPRPPRKSSSGEPAPASPT